MKMITAIVNKKDAAKVCEALAQAGFFFTKMAIIFRLDIDKGRKSVYNKRIINILSFFGASQARKSL